MKELRDSILRAVSLVVTDRRWAAPLSAMALGFGLFLGVAIGPGADGSLATGAGQVIAVAAPAEERSVGAGGGGEPAPSESAPEPFAAAEPEAFEPPPSEEFAPEPLAPEPEQEPEAPLPPSEPPPEEEEAESEAVQLKGTVVRANSAAGSYALATGSGELVSVHAPKLPPAGAKLSVEATPLPNNTFAEEERKGSGATTAASLSGVVTYVDPDPADPAYTLSGRGSSILVHAAPAAAAGLPALGSYAKVGVGIEKPPPVTLPVPEAAPVVPLPPSPCVADPALVPPPPPATRLVQRSIEVEPEPATYLDLAGVVAGLCPATGQLLISADDLRESGADVTLTVPAKLATVGLTIGDSILATATRGEDGSLTLAGLASDERLEGAEDTASAQGDLKR